MPLVWCCSVHTRIIDMAINEALHRDWMPASHTIRLPSHPCRPNIQPAEIHRRQAMLSLCCWALAPGHLLYHKLADPAKQHRQLKSRHPFVPATEQFFRTIEELNINVARWADHAWSAECASSLCSFIHDARPHPQGLAMSRPA